MLVRMATIKKSANKKCWRGCGEKGTLLHCWQECKLVTSTMENSVKAKVRLVKAMVFPVVMYGCESWTVKKAEH